MKPKIFLLYPYYWPFYKAGGPVQSLFNLSVVLKQTAIFFTLSKDKDIDGSQSPLPIKINQWTKGANEENIFYTRAISPWLVFKLIKATKPDVILINGIFNVSTTVSGILAARWCHSKMVLSPRGMLQKWGLDRGKLKKMIFLKLLKLFLRRTEEWHATDEQERKDILRIFGARQLVHTAPNIPRKASEPNRLSLPTDGKIRLVFLSLIGPNKNLHLAIDAVKGNKKFELDIYGPIANKAYWKLCQQRMAGAQSIVYRGPIPPWNISEVFGEYHFFVLPTQGENYGHAIFDALSCGLPVIISRNTPWSDLESHGAGIYVNIEPDSDLNVVLQRILSLTDADYQTYRTSAHNYAQSYWSTRDYFKDYDFLLRTNI